MIVRSPRPSYEGWKHLPEFEPQTYDRARDLPMRDGNFPGPFRAPGAVDGPRPSYEGWKLKGGRGSSGARSGPRPSYEGWKPEREDAHNEKMDSPRPSYEGWKLSAFNGSSYIVAGPRPSYEGWKPPQARKSPRPLSAPATFL